MTTIAELLTMDAVGTVSVSQAADALMAFMRRFDSRLAEAMTYPMTYDGFDETGFMGRVRCDLLIEGREDDDLNYLGRLMFDGQPFALLRLDAGRSEDSLRRWTVRLTGRDIADNLVLAIIEWLRVSDNKVMAEVSWSADAGALLDFGPTAKLDVAAQALSYHGTKRLLLLADDTPVAVLSLVEDGSFLVGIVEGGEDVFRVYPQSAAAREAFVREMERRLARPVDARRLFILHGRNDTRTVGLMADREGNVSCAVIDGRGPREVQATGAHAAPTFSGIASDIVDEALSAAGRGYAALKTGRGH